jgi:nucleoid-associated protein YgaU
VVEALGLKFTYFSSDGTPLRAQASLTLRQFSDEPWPPQNPTSGTPHPHSVHYVLPGETLDRIAATRYGDATRWRVLAEANRVIDPLALEPGTPLVVPELEVRTRG